MVGDRHPNRLHHERFDGSPLSKEYRERYHGRLESLTNFPVIKTARRVTR